MYKIRTILVPIDFSDHSYLALNYAKNQAQSMNSALHIIHVIEPSVYPADWGYSQVGFVDLEKELTEAAEKKLQQISADLAAEGIQSTTKVVSGRASDMIVAYAEEHKVDMISIATQGRSGIEHFLFGSTTERVLRKAPCAVLAVRQPPHKEQMAAKNSDDASS